LLELRRHKIVLSDQARVLQYQVDKSVAKSTSASSRRWPSSRKAGEFPGRDDRQSPDAHGQVLGADRAHLGLGSETVHVLEVAAPMHDIGKIGILIPCS